MQPYGSFASLSNPERDAGAQESEGTAAWPERLRHRRWSTTSFLILLIVKFMHVCDCLVAFLYATSDCGLFLKSAAKDGACRGRSHSVFSQ